MIYIKLKTMFYMRLLCFEKDIINIYTFLLTKYIKSGIIMIDKNNWKTRYYLAYNKANQCGENDVEKGINILGSCIEEVLHLIDENLAGDEQAVALIEVYMKTAMLSRRLFEETKTPEQAIAASNVMYDFAEHMRRIFDDKYERITYQVWMCGVNMTRKCGGIEPILF